jgi:hypothetical protein
MKKVNIEVRKLLKSFIGFCLFFSTIIFLIENSLSYFVSISSDAQTGKYNLVMAHKIDPELIIFGSSVAEVGFDNKVISNKLDKSVYNLAIDGTRIISSKFIIDEFLSYSKKCDVAIIGLVYTSFENIQEMTEPSRFLAHKSNIFLKKNIKKVSPKLYNNLYHIPFYSFILANHTYYKNAVIGLKGFLKGQYLQLDTDDGFVSHNAIYNDTRRVDHELDTIHISNSGISDFTQIIKEIKEHGITPILVITPMHKNGQSSFMNYDFFISNAKGLAYETNTLLVDFSKHDMVNNEKYFYNNVHLNSVGALCFSLSLIDSLSNRIQKNTIFMRNRDGNKP